MAINKNKGLVSGTIAALAFTVCCSLNMPEASANGEAEKIMDYDMSNIEGSTVKDSTGSFNGKLINPEKAELVTNDETNTGVVNFKGGTVDSYIEIPKGVIEGLESVTVSSLVNWEGSGGAQWLYGLGQSDTHYLYYTPSYIGGSTGRLGLATDGWRNETFAQSPKLASKEWKLVTTVMNGSEKTIKTFIDGELAATGSTNGVTLSNIINKEGLSGYIGKSFYAPDPYFGGMVADFEIYNGALKADQIKELQTAAEEKIQSIGSLNDYFLKYAASQLDYPNFLLNNRDSGHITTDLALPLTGAYGTVITWKSDKPVVIGNDGKVNRPPYEEGDQAVTMTATISDGSNSVVKEFTVNVVKRIQDSEAVKADAKSLVIHNIDDVRGNLNLPSKGKNGSSIVWKTSDASVITATGEVSRPAFAKGDKKVVLTATMTLNNESVVKEFTVIVKESPEKVEDNAAYMMTYFNGEAYADGEQIRFALSEGNDVTQWNEINDGKPVITSHLGEEGLRDPSIIRSPEGDKFYLLATDLKVYGTGGDWGRTVREGSNSLMIWESTDLVNWSEQRMVDVTGPETGNTWAPEVYYDDSTGEYIVYWSSFVYDSVADRYGNGTSHNRIMYAKTRDFHTFTEPETLLDLGHDILDTVAIDHEDKVYRITKGTYFTEKELAGEEIREHVFQEVGDSFFGDFELTKEGIGMDVLDHGEGAEIFKSNTEEDKFYLLIDEYGNGRGYTLFETDDLASADWKLSDDINLPDRPRHGDVLNITQEEFERLQTEIPSAGGQPAEPKDIVGNPVIKDRFSADPAALEHNGKVYMYVGHDEASVTGNFFELNEWDIYSSDDMDNWKLEGSMPRTTFGWATGASAWASEAVEKDGKFYWYVTVDNGDSKAPGFAIGVAESDDPVNGWKDALGAPLIKSTDTVNPEFMGEDSWDDIDPTVFIDDDGQAYLYWGNTHLYYAKLKDNMKELDGEIQKVEIGGMPGTFTEGPHLHKANGKYYMTYAMNYPEELAYAMSDSPKGPWEFKGKLMDTLDSSPTSHPAVIEYKNEWYFIYHNAALPTGGEYRRSVAIEKMQYNPDGTIQKIVPTASGIKYPSYSLQAYKNMDQYVRHSNSGLRLDSLEEDTYDFQWHQVSGLANSEESYKSFQSENNPGFYLVRDGNDVKIAKHDGTRSFKERATFKVVPGLADEEFSSFQAYKDEELYLHQNDDSTIALQTAETEAEKVKATFRLGEFNVAPPADEEAPSAPAGLTAKASVDTVELNWTASTDNEAVAGYKVYRNGQEIGTTEVAAYRDSGLADATVYEYSVRAFDAAGNVSEASETVNVTTSTSTDLLKGRLDGLVKSGDVGGPLVKKLENALDQAIQQKAKGHEAQAAKHLEDFLKHLDKAKADQVTAEAKTALKKRADLLIALWSKE